MPAADVTKFERRIPADAALPAGSPPTLLGPPPALAGLPTLPNTGAVSILPTQPASPPPVIGPRNASSPFAGSQVIGGMPFTVPPWQSGQPGGPPTERIERSWAVVDLPAFDPEVYERQRRIVLRVAGGLLAVILLVAILVGHC